MDKSDQSARVFYSAALGANVRYDVARDMITIVSIRAPSKVGGSWQEMPENCIELPGELARRVAEVVTDWIKPPSLILCKEACEACERRRQEAQV